MKKEKSQKLAKRVCPYCGEEKFVSRDFYGSESLMYSNEKRHLICKNCMNIRYNFFLAKCDGDELLALRRTCDNLDIVFDEGIVNRVEGQDGSLFLNYMKTINTNSILRSLSSLDSPMFNEMHSKPNIEDLVVNNDIVMKWGDGFTKREYQQLEYIYSEYMEEYKPKDLSTKKILKDLSMTELLRERARLKGDDKTYDMYTKLLSKSRADANIQPNQNKDEDDEKYIFGMMMKIYELKKPVVKRLKEYQDVDWIERYIMRFLFKPLAVALGFGSGNYSLEEGDAGIQLDEKIERAIQAVKEEEEEEKAKRKNGDS